MPSPFPGMDPYLEASGRWPDFHSRFINACSEVLLQRLPDHYDARIEERVQLVDLDAEQPRIFRPDVGVVRDPLKGGASSQRGVAILPDVETAVLHHPQYIEETTGYIAIHTLPGGELVTAIELLSPSNKSEPGFGPYRAKCEALLAKGVHVVELDLLAGGERLPLREPLPRGDYFAFVSRGDHRPECQVYAWTVRHALPTAIPIPLKPPDGDVPLDLAVVFTLAYERGRYARSIHYEVPCTAPLAPSDIAWATDHAQAQAKR